MNVLSDNMLTLSKYGIIIFSALVLIRCLRSLLNERYDSEVWAYARVNGERIPITHWENIIGRGVSADIRVYAPGVSRVHAVLTRDDKGVWKIFDVFSKGGVWINDRRAEYNGAQVRDGDHINLAGTKITFIEPEDDKRQRIEDRRSIGGGDVSPFLTLLWLTLFQLSLLIQHLISADAEYVQPIMISFISLIVLQWLCFAALKLINRSGFEIEILAFYLTSLGLSVAVTSTPDDLYKHSILIIICVVMFLIFGWWLRNLKRTSVFRIPFAVIACGLLALNIVSGTTISGATNWLSIAGYSFQPSELVKVFYVYVGASTLDRLYMKKNLYLFVGFSAVCVLALALMGDFGSALVFFITFLVISFMRSGSIATVVLAVSGAVMAGLMAVTARPYIAKRFATWGHAWEDIYDSGYQQVRTMSAAAAGGLFGKGAGRGWLRGIVAANTDMVFGIVSEELGLIVAFFSVAAVIIIAIFAVRSARHSRSAYNAIAGCASVSIMLSQLALNVFGSMDMLPFTGVTFPFISRGGSSLLSCWMLTAFIKSADNRRDASFAVRSASSYSRIENLTMEDGDEVYIPDEERML